MAEYLTSRTNPYLQQVKRLISSRKDRYALGRFVADGPKLVDEAIRWGLRPEAVLVREDLDYPVPEGVRHIRVPARLMADISRMDTPQGVLAVCPMPARAPARPVPGCLILDGIQDPGNLGTILRTADAFDVPVFLSDGCADPYSEKTVRATMGAVFRSPPVQASAQTLLDGCRAAGIPVCVTALTGAAKDIRRVALEQCATVIGSEGRGVSPLWLQAADLAAVIPMEPRCESLNAGVAAAIVLWQLRAGR